MDETTFPHVPHVPHIPQGRSARVVFTGVRDDFFRLVRRGALLELITAGFYRFWLTTDIRRALWSGTSIEGDAAEYAGTARELLIGFLFALAILVPIYVIYTLVGIEAERTKAFASIPLVLFFYAFGQFAIFRARRYRATRTVWRGVRFWMSGSGWAYSWRACLWGLLTIVTLGAALPWRESALERYKMGHLHYGDLPARFEGTGLELFKRAWGLWLLCLIFLVLLVFVIPFSLLGLTNGSAASARLGAAIVVIRFFSSLYLFVFLVTSPFIYAAYKAIVWRWWLSGIRIGEVRFESDLYGGALIGLYWATIGWIALISAVGIVVIFLLGLSIQSLFSGHFGTSSAFMREHPYVLLGARLADYLLAALCVNVAIRVYLVRGVWERVVTSTTVYNLDRADNVQARGDLVSALGEGLADGLDVAGF